MDGTAGSRTDAARIHAIVSVAMSDCNGFRLKGLNPACDRVSIKSNVQSTWMMTYKRMKNPVSHEIAMTRHELVILKCEDGADSAEVEICPLGDKAGTMIVESSRKATRTLRVGAKYRWELEPGEALICRTSLIVHPVAPGAGMVV